MESVSIVNNGSKVTEKWMSEYAYYLDIMAVSCDSFDAETNTYCFSDFHNCIQLKKSLIILSFPSIEECKLFRDNDLILTSVLQKSI